MPPTPPLTARRDGSRRLVALATVFAGLALALGCGSKSTAPAEGSATIGADGGTVRGPDGTQLVVPAGALATDVTIRIARSGAGAPPPTADLASFQKYTTYEVTPHGLTFAQPAQLNLPAPAGAASDVVVFAAEVGGEWNTVPATVVDGMTTVTRYALSWFVGGASGDCTSSPSSPPWNCLFARFTGGGISGPAGAVIPGPQYVAARVVQPTTITATANLEVPYPCGGGTVDVKETFRPSDPGGSAYTDRQLLTGTPVSLGGGRSPKYLAGTHTFNAAIEASKNGTVRYDYFFQCDGPTGGRWRARAVSVYVVDISPPASLPIITTQPSDVQVNSGQTALFSLRATALHALAVDWQRSDDQGTTWASQGVGTAVTGGSDLAFATTLSDTGAKFRASVCDVSGASRSCALTAVAMLTVAPTPVAPIFTTAPASVTVTAGQSAGFTAVASGAPAPAIRWQVAASGSSTFVDVAGEPACLTTPPATSGTSTASTCTLAQTPIANSGQRYRAVATSSAAPGGVPSAEATLTLTAGPVGPTITQQPTAQQAFVGGSASFTVAATGTAPLTYAWRVNGLQLPLSGGAFTRGSCTGASSPVATTLTLTGVSAGCDGATVDVQVSNGIATVTSSAVRLTVVPATRSLSLLAGEIGGPGLLDGIGGQARVTPAGFGAMAVDASGTGYFVDQFSGGIRKVSTAGMVTTLPDVSGALPRALAADSSGKVYVTETGNVRRISLLNADGSRTVLAGGATSGQQDGPGAQATFIGPYDVAVGGPTGDLYVVDQDFVHNARVRKITSAGVVSTFYDFGTATPTAGRLAVTPSGEVYATGAGPLANTVVRVGSAGVTVIAGSPNQFGLVDGTGSAARFGATLSLASDASGDLLVTDPYSKSIRRVTPTGVVTTVSGTPGTYLGPGVDGAPGTARWVFPSSIAFAPNGSFLVSDLATLRWLSPTFVTTTFAGKNLDQVAVDGTGAAARFYIPVSPALEPSGNAYVVSVGALRKVTPTGVVSTLPGTAGFQQNVRDSTGFLVAATPSAVYRLDASGTRTLLAGDPNTSGTLDGQGSAALFDGIGGLAVDAAGNVFVSQPSDHVIRRVTPGGAVTTYAGSAGQPGALDGPRLGATLNSPVGLAVDGSGNLYVADSNNDTIRRISAAGDVSTVAGKAQNGGSDDGTGAAARFSHPRPLALDPAGNLLIVDSANFTIRRMTPQGTVTTVLGHVGQRAVVLGSDPQLNDVRGLAVRPDGTVVLISEGALLEAVLP